MRDNRDCRTCRELNCACVHAFGEIVLILPENTQLPTPAGKWTRLDSGEIVAIYTPQELWWAKRIAQVIKELDYRNLKGDH